MAVMNCERIQDQLLELFGEKEQSEQIAEHLRGCPECRAFAEELEELSKAAGSNEDFFPDPEITEALIAGVEQKIDRIETTKAVPLHAAWRSYVPAVAALLVVIGFSATAYMLNVFSSQRSLTARGEGDTTVAVVAEGVQPDSLNAGDINYILNDYTAQRNGTSSDYLLEDVSQDELEYLENNLKAGDFL